MLDDAQTAVWRELGAACDRLGWTARRLWIGYFEVGGNGSADDVGAWLGGTTMIPDLDHDYLAQAMNDGFTGLGHTERVPYRGLR